jgi:hypothetical protein
LVATALLLPVGAVPAHAVDPVTIVQAAIRIYDMWKAHQDGGKTIDEATTEIINAVNAAKTDIIAHADALAVVPAKACTTHAVIELADIAAFSRQTLENWAQDVTGCVTLIDSLLGAVNTNIVTSELGYSLNIVGPIALLARTRAGFSTTLLSSVLLRATGVLDTKLGPTCAHTVYPDPLQAGVRWDRVACSAFGVVYPNNVYVTRSDCLVPCTRPLADRLFWGKWWSAFFSSRLLTYNAYPVLGVPIVFPPWENQ